MTSGPFGEIPVLPVAIPLGALTFGVLLLCLWLRATLTWPRALLMAVVAAYTAGIFANTIFPIYLSPAPGAAASAPYIAWIPFYDYELEDALMNVAVFLPLGMLIPLLLRCPTWWKVLLTVAAVSAGIETAQFAAGAFLNGGHIADINDFIWNVAGGISGYLLIRLSMRSPKFAHFARSFRPHTTACEAPWVA